MPFDLNAKLQEIRAMNASKDEKQTLSAMVASEYANSYMDEADKKETSKNYFHWEEDDIKTVLNGIKEECGEKDTWEYGLFKSEKYLTAIENIAKDVDRTSGAIHSLLKIATIGGNISKAKKKKGGIESAIRFKKVALSVGLITEKSYVDALYRGYTDDVLSLSEFVTNIDIDAVETTDTVTTESIDAVVEDGVVVPKRVVKVSVKKKKNMGDRKFGERYTFDERVDIFKKVVSKLGDYKNVESIYGNTSFSGFPPRDLTQTYANIASAVPNRTTSAIKNSVDHAVLVTRHPDRKYTKSKMEIYDAAVEAGFIV